MPISNQQLYDKLNVIEVHIGEIKTELKQIPEMKDDIKDLEKLKVKVGQLEVKSGIIGAIAGGVIIAVNYIIQSLKQ